MANTITVGAIQQTVTLTGDAGNGAFATIGDIINLGGIYNTLYLIVHNAVTSAGALTDFELRVHTVPDVDPTQYVPLITGATWAGPAALPKLATIGGVNTLGVNATSVSLIGIGPCPAISFAASAAGANRHLTITALFTVTAW